MRAIAAIVLAAAAVSARGAEQPFGVLDIVLGASHARLAQELDFRDIPTALAAPTGGKPDFGKRGYGCMTRDDAFADVACVSHEEKLEGVATREIRLVFLQGRLQQFSLSAEQQHHDAVIDYLRRRYGEPRQVAPSAPGAAPAWRWESDAAHVAAHRGPHLVFVNFELASYPEAVKRKREGVGLDCR